MSKNKIVAWLSAVSGVVASILGVLGVLCATPVCGVICVGGIVTAIAGIGAVGFLHKYNVILIVVGICATVIGVILIIKCRRKCACVDGQD